MEVCSRISLIDKQHLIILLQGSYAVFLYALGLVGAYRDTPCEGCRTCLPCLQSSMECAINKFCLSADKERQLNRYV
jgi:hypothetical protein